MHIAWTQRTIKRIKLSWVSESLKCVKEKIHTQKGTAVNYNKPEDRAEGAEGSVDGLFIVSNTRIDS